MIISCPSCDAQYLLPDDAISAKGRRVKCTSCSYTWLQHPEDVEHEETPAAVPVIDETEAQVEESRKRRQALVGSPQQVFEAQRAEAPFSKVITSGVLWAIGAFVVLFLGSIVIRGSIVSMWEPAALLFESIGLPAEVPGKGLAFKDVKITTTAPSNKEGGSIIVKGTLSNTIKSGVFLPNLRVRLEGANGWLKDWDIGLQGKYLPIGKSMSFEYTLEDAPAGGQNVTVLFIN